MTGIRSFLDNLFGRASLLGRSFAENAVNAAAQGAARDFVQQPQTGFRGPPPPASTHVNIPRVVVTPEDLQDPVNRECCVCLEPHPLHERVCRLPCAHIFHEECITNWLRKHCTCPVCRYEMPTDDPQFEQGRHQRMRDRKPRFARHELERLTIKELKQLITSHCKNAANNTHFAEKRDILEFLIQSNVIELVAAPDPVSYPISVLQAMSVAELKACMSDAGVFFDPKDVVEKDDMLRIFVSSGRLNLFEDDTLEREKASRKEAQSDPINHSTTSFPPPFYSAHGTAKVESVSAMNGRLALSDERTDTNVLMEINEDYQEPMNVDTMSHHSVESDGISYEDVQSLDEGTSFSSGQGVINRGQSEQATNDEDIHVPAMDGPHIDPTVCSSTPRMRLEDLTVSQLKRLGLQKKIDMSGCIERRDLIQRLIESKQGIDLETYSCFKEWHVSEIRAVAAATEVNLNGLLDRAQMWEHLQQAADERPYIAQYIKALVPLMRLSVPELRAEARARNVDVSNCLEKEEVISRLLDQKRGN